MCMIIFEFTSMSKNGSIFNSVSIFACISELYSAPCSFPQKTFSGWILFFNNLSFITKYSLYFVFDENTYDKSKVQGYGKIKKKNLCNRLFKPA